MPLREILSAGAGGDTGVTDDQYTATLIVAASDSRNPAAAHYICDGVADDVQINLALNALPDYGGRVVLFEGTFAIADPIVIPDSNITLEGQGSATFIDGDALVTGQHAIELNGHDECALRKFIIQTENGSGKNCRCISITGDVDRLLIEEIIILDSASEGIRFSCGIVHDTTIKNCVILDTDADGIEVLAETLLRLQIRNNIVLSSGFDGIDVEVSTSSMSNLIAENVVTNVGLSAIEALNFSYSQILNNSCYLAGEEGIDLNGGIRVQVEGNYCIQNAFDGILVNDTDECQIIGNYCYLNNYAQEGQTYNGIRLFAALDTQAHDNFLIANRGSGIYDGGGSTRTGIVGNRCEENGEHGIRVATAEILVATNHCYDNSQALADTDDGIYLHTGSDRCNIVGNWCGSSSEQTQVQSCGIQLAAGVDYCQVEGNYCYQNLASGILVSGDSDYNHIIGNFCQFNSIYGIDIASVDGNENVVMHNRLPNNVGAPFRDNGVSTIVHEVWCPIVNSKQLVTTEVLEITGYRPVTPLVNGADDYAYVTLQVPADMQQMLDARWVIIPGASGNLVWQGHANYGWTCVEVHNTHTGNTVLATSAVTLNELECLDVATAMASVAAGDNVGLRFFRNGVDQDDTVAADCYAVGLRFRYV